MPETLRSDTHRLRKAPNSSTIERNTPRGRATPLSARGSASKAAETDHVAASVALHNLRGLAITFVLMLHSTLAYLGSNGATPSAFDRPPYGWLEFPVIDRQRWFGFDVFCAWQDVYLMGLMFFLSGVFTWRSLAGQGVHKFIGKRLWRLGVPLLFGLIAVMPVALYPVYLETAVRPSLAGYAHEYLALPFLPIGPMWFLWFLLGFAGIAAGLRVFLGEKVASAARYLEQKPQPAFAAWIVIAIAAYLPLALLFTPWRWGALGPFGLQLSRPLLYLVYYLVGVAIGANGLGRGLLRVRGGAASNWKTWMVAAAASLILWMGLTALTIRLGSGTPLPLAMSSDASYALAGSCSLVFALAICLRFGAGSRWPVIATVSDNALGVYVLHYAPVVWMQYALLGLAWPAPIKALAVFCLAAAACLAATAAASSLLGRAWRARHASPRMMNLPS